MKILHVGEYVSGGVATYLRNVLNYQANLDCVDEVHLLISDYKSELLNLNKKINVKRLSYRRNIRSIIKMSVQVHKYIDLINPDIIHVHSSIAGLFVRIMYFIKKKKSKIVYCSHGWSFLIEESFVKKKLYSTIERLLSTKTDLIINISNFELKGSLQEKIPTEKSIVIYNGINDFRINVAPNNLPEIDQNKINIVYIGRFDKVKGIDILLEVFSNMVLSHLDLYLIGDSVLKDHNIIVPKNVKQLGWIDNQFIDSYIKLFDAVIVPSRGEGFGIVAIEAMKNARAVIASNRGALPEIVMSNRNGYVFDLENKNSLINILRSLNKERLEELGSNGRQDFEKKFISNTMNEKTINFYKEILEK